MAATAVAIMMIIIISIIIILTLRLGMQRMRSFISLVAQVALTQTTLHFQTKPKLSFKTNAQTIVTRTLDFSRAGLTEVRVVILHIFCSKRLNRSLI
jgi:hypothetical protein